MRLNRALYPKRKLIFKNKLDLIAKASGSESFSSRRKTPRTPLQANSKLTSAGMNKQNNNEEEVRKMSQTATNNFNQDNKESFVNDNKSVPDVQSESQNYESSIDNRKSSFVMKQNAKDIRSSFKKDKEEVEMSIIESKDSEGRREVS